MDVYRVDPVLLDAIIVESQRPFRPCNVSYGCTHVAKPAYFRPTFQTSARDLQILSTDEADVRYWLLSRISFISLLFRKTTCFHKKIIYLTLSLLFKNSHYHP